MAAAATDYFKKVGNPGTATTLSAPGYTAGATSITVASTTNWPTDTGVTFCMYEVTTVGTETVMTAGTYNEYDGVVTGATSIGSLSHVAGSGTDRNYASGSGTVVTIMVTSGRENGIVDGLVVSHNQDGTLKAGAVDSAAVLASDVVETAKIKDANVSTTKIADGAVTLPKINGGSTAGILQTDASGNVSSVAVSRQDNATNSTISGLKLCSGWSYFPTGTGSSAAKTKAITFPLTYSSAPVVMVSYLGRVAGANPANITSFTTGEEDVSFSVNGISTTGFTASGYKPSNFSNANSNGFSWIAIGA